MLHKIKDRRLRRAYCALVLHSRRFRKFAVPLAKRSYRISRVSCLRLSRRIMRRWIPQVHTYFRQNAYARVAAIAMIGALVGMMGTSKYYTTRKIPNDYADGQALMQKSKFREAAQHFERALESNPENFAARVSLAGALHADGQLEAALEHYTQADDWASKVMGAFYENSLGLQKQIRNESVTVELLKKHSAFQPTSSETHYQLAMLHASQRQPEAALCQLEEAIRLNPRHVSATVEAGKLAEFTGQRGRAGQLYRRALRLDPNYIEAKERLAALVGGDRMETPVSVTKRVPASRERYQRKSKSPAKKYLSTKTRVRARAAMR